MLFGLLQTHSTLRRVSLLCLTALLAALTLSLSYKEDISDFLPLGTGEREALDIYQDIAGAGRLVVVFEGSPDSPERMEEAVDAFAASVGRRDTMGWTADMVTQVDMERVEALQGFVYDNMPYFLTAGDYRRMDSILSSPGEIDRLLERDREMLLLPSGGVVADNLSRDPLGLFAPVAERLRGESRFEIYDGYIFTPDMSRAVATLTSPFGNAETERNAVLTAMLDSAIADMQASCPDIRAHVTGGPQIAVDNARQIKRDSVVAIAIAAVLIMALLLYSLRSVRNIMLVALTVAWGWLFAMGGLALLRDSVSIIVIGMASVIMGIAVNYPLHLVAHMRHCSDVRQAVREIAAPLLIGNVTTVGAFLALVPLESTALRDLGLFASLLLAGTILFVLTYLPHMVRAGGPGGGDGKMGLLTRIAGVRLEEKRWAVWAVAVLTVAFGWLSLRTEFDPDMANINFMTEQQREDMQYFSRLTEAQDSSMQTLYVVSSAPTMDGALERALERRPRLDSLSGTQACGGYDDVTRFLVSKREQERRLGMWDAFRERHREALERTLPEAARRHGFSEGAFGGFGAVLGRDYRPQEFGYFRPLADLAFRGNISTDEKAGRYSVVERLQVRPEEMDRIRASLDGSFDVRSMNSALARNLSDDFNYIGLACSAIVFLFLWLSMGRVELALLAFLPMAVSWIWILGIMALLGIKFNIVNIILATFIFGQGDDYTIFMTEGCQYEYARRRPMLASFKNSIILSAVIMFTGIGALITARHPALLSLAQVTIVGMACVVLMAWMLPPLVFRWLVMSGGRYRRRPLTLASLCRTWLCGAIWLLQLLYGYAVGFVLFVLTKPSAGKREYMHRLTSRVHRADMRFFPGIRFRMENPNGEDFSRPCVVACNHQSMLDPMCLMALSPRIIIVANRRSSLNPVIRMMFRWLDCYTLRENRFREDLEVFRRRVGQGYSIAVFPEGERNPDPSVLRFHKGLFLLAHELGVDIVPAYIHGMNDVMPIRSFATNGGQVTVTVGERIGAGSPLWGDGYQETTRNVHRLYKEEHARHRRRLENAAYFAPLVADRYLYKGMAIQGTVRRNMRRANNYADTVDRHYPEGQEIVVENCGYGEEALLMALVHPDNVVVARDPDEEKLEILRICGRGVVRNLKVFRS